MSAAADRLALRREASRRHRSATGTFSGRPGSRPGPPWLEREGSSGSRVPPAAVRTSCSGEQHVDTAIGQICLDFRPTPFDVEKSTLTPIHSRRRSYYGPRHVVVQRADGVAGASARRTTPRLPPALSSRFTRFTRNSRCACTVRIVRNRRHGAIEQLTDTSEFCRSPRLAHVL
jgi:hypothetical protein